MTGGGNITATTDKPARITVHVHLKDNLKWSSGNSWQRNAVAKDENDARNQTGNDSLGNVRITQWQLINRLVVTNPEITPVVDNNDLTSTEILSVQNASFAKNNQATHCIQNIEVSKNGIAIIVYKDGTKSDPIPQSVTVNERPKPIIPYDNKETKEIYVYRGENVNLTFKAVDDSGKISSLKFEMSGSVANIVNMITNDEQAIVTVNVIPDRDLIWRDGNRWGRKVTAIDPSGNSATTIEFTIQQD